MNTSSAPRPTCCADALFNWVMHVDFEGDIPSDEINALPANCPRHPAH